MSPLLRWGLLGSLGSSLLVLVALPEPAAEAQAQATGLLGSRTQGLLEGAAAAAAAQPVVPPVLPLPPALRSAAWPPPPATALAAWASHPQAATQPTSPTRDAVGSVGSAGPSVPALPASAVAASAPATPSFPYRYIGHLDDGEDSRIFIASAQQTWALQPGQALDGQWRLDSFAQGQLQFTWLATGTTVTVSTR